MAARTGRPVVVAERYEVVRCVGAGTQASVFLVFDHEGQESLALKTVASADDEVQAWDLLREADLLGRLSHPCVVGLIDVIEVGEAPALLLEFAGGGSVRQWMEHYGTLPAGTALQVTLECASALEHAHAQGVYHLDVKPGNLVIRADGSVALVDFGIAACASRPRREVPGFVMGSPGFMAPEQRGTRRGTIDGRADVYALGATLYRMCTGRRERNLYRCADEPALLDGLPEPVAALIEACCRLEPAARPQTMAEVRERTAAALAAVGPRRVLTGLVDPRGASRDVCGAVSDVPVDLLRLRLGADVRPHRRPRTAPRRAPAAR